MGIFKRRRPASDLGELDRLAVEGRHAIMDVSRAHHQGWGAGGADTWRVDQDTGTITWDWRTGRTATAPVQFIGSLAGSGHTTWLWAWANDSIDAPLRTDVERVRQWGEEHAADLLTTPKVHADADRADALAAIAFRITEASGFYRGPGRLTTYVTFGPVTIVEPDGRVSKFVVGNEASSGPGATG